MYRCRVCGNESEPGVSQLRHQVKRMDGTIQQELAVCQTCLVRLRVTPLEVLVREYSSEPAATKMPAVAAVPLKAVAVPPKSLAQRINETRSTN